MSTATMASISIRSAEHRRTRYENTSIDGAEVQTNGFSTIAKFRASSVVFADVTAFTIVRLEVTAISLHEIVTSLSKDTAFDDVLVHAFVCKHLNNISIKD